MQLWAKLRVGSGWLQYIFWRQFSMTLSSFFSTGFQSTSVLRSINTEQPSLLAMEWETTSVGLMSLCRMLGEEMPCRCVHKHLGDPIHKVTSIWKYQTTLVGHVEPFDLLSDSFANIRCRWCPCGLARSWMHTASVSACVIALALRR